MEAYRRQPVPPVCYRNFQDDDLKAVATVWLESWQSIGLDVAALTTEFAFQERIRLELATGWRVIVAAEDEQVVGFLATKPTEGVLDQLFISPSAKNRGIGTALLKRAMTEMPDGFWLRTADANRAACAFYEARGLRRDRMEPHPRLGHMTAIYVWP
jgi:ribosomal protein S18 acetylase RimI-like enzyme